jgi:hypothetical protein
VLRIQQSDNGLVRGLAAISVGGRDRTEEAGLFIISCASFILRSSTTGALFCHTTRGSLLWRSDRLLAARTPDFIFQSFLFHPLNTYLRTMELAVSLASASNRSTVTGRT